ncbi:nucleotidyl transferase AbiEii/AbiGii toxin family protein [Acidovorax sp. LjRoot129]|uniref:nucleotidyl transferase AbiEii/AbiGii toxin family protein n=1 Tax=Acidovorax sp. LjRoot129 TaxID=3342260 RepID=UPI003ECF4FEE
MLKTSPDRPVDPLLRDILQLASTAARSLHIDFFVGGALARDLMLWHVHGQSTGRATRDVDLGLHLTDWAAFSALKDQLLAEGSFQDQPGVAHRLLYRPAATVHGIPLDLLPFGAVASPHATIAWPPEHAVVMNVAGFAEAHRAAVEVDLDGALAVRVASLPSLAVLKLIAWGDRHLDTSKDATDFLLIARRYAEAGNINRLYETGTALLQACDYDPDLAGAMLLGQDAAAATTQATTAQAVADILDRQGRWRQRLDDQLQRALQLAGALPERGQHPLRHVDAFLQGFLQGQRPVAD